MTESYALACPYCGESGDTELDLSDLAPGDTQQYIEDCYVCCRPIVFTIVIDSAGGIGSIEIRRDNE